MNIKERAREILAGMTLEEKLGQLNMLYIGMYDNGIDELKKAVRAGDGGSVIIAGSIVPGDGDDTELHKEIAELQRIAVEESPSKIPLLFGRDVIHGHKVVNPIPLAMSASFNFDLIKEAYAETGEEAMCDGINWTFAPMLDMARDPRWGRVIECPGEDPYVGTKVAKAVVEGFQGTEMPYKMAACAKHYIGYGASEGGRDYHRAEISDYSLRNYYTKAFKSAADANVLTVMNSFNEINGQPTTSSKYYLTDILRGELGFDGFVVSDAGAVHQLTRQGVAKDYKDAAGLALNAGLDMEMNRLCFPNLRELIDEGKVTVETVDTAALRIIETKLKLGLFENPYSQHSTFDLNKHLETSRKLAGESVVLLKNKDNILPLDKEAKIALTGPFLHTKRDLLGCWTLDFDLDYVTTIGDAIKAVAPNATEFTALRQYDLKNYDTVVAVLGEAFDITGEAHSVTDISISKAQAEEIHTLKRLGKKIIAVISAGRPLALSEIEEEVDAIVYVWHGGTQTGLAAADVLFGDVCPSGRLPITFPRVTGQIPIFYNCPPSGRLCNGYYSDDLQWTNYEDCLSTPLYPFGYGLSYTEFEYSDMTVSKEKFTLDELKNGIKASVTVSNTGNRDAKEVVQLYIRDLKASYTRPLKELKGTEKLLIESGKAVTVHFELTDKDLGYFTPHGEYIVEEGEFEIFIGHDSYTENKITVELF